MGSLDDIADEITEISVLEFEQEAIALQETVNGWEVKPKYKKLRDRIYEILKTNLKS